MPGKSRQVYCSQTCGWAGMHRNRHSPEICEQVTKLIHEGLTCREAGEVVGLSTNAVEGIKKRCAIATPKRICLQCGIKFHGEYRRKYCTPQCAWNAQQGDARHCIQCGKRLKRQQLHCCSRECYALVVIEAHKNTPFDNDVTKLWNEGLSTAEIGRRLGVTKNQVIGRAHRLHLTPRPSPLRHRAEPAEPRFMIHEARIASGRDPLPPMHPISWGAIAL